MQDAEPVATYQGGLTLVWMYPLGKMPEDNHGVQPPRPLNGQAREFAALFRESSRVLWLVAVGIVGDAALADDVVQEAAIVGYRKFDRFQMGSNFAAWMAQTVRFVALNEARREQRRATISLDDDTRTPSLRARESEDPPPGHGHRAEGPASGGATAGFSRQVHDALRGVSEVARACLLLRTLDGLEYSRIAELLGIPEGTAMSHVHRTRQYMRERLAGSGADLRERKRKT